MGMDLHSGEDEEVYEGMASASEGMVILAYIDRRVLAETGQGL
jgi:hypothetical protein